jgi:PAS domain S-box-containing protein
MGVPATESLLTDAQRDGGIELDRHLLSLIAGGEAGEPAEPAPIAVSGRLRAAHYRQFLDALGVAMYTTDAAGRITFFNAAAAEFWGRRPALGEEWCGSLELLFPDEAPMRHDQCPMAIALTERRAVRGGEAIAVRPDGSRVRFVPYPTPLFDDEGELIGAVNVLVDITERYRAQEDSRAAARALAASNAVKDEFLGLVSHELRTPVTTIYGNARLLQTRAADLDEAVKASMLADMAADADRLHSIIENLLHLTRLGSGSTVELEPQVLERVVDRSVRSYQTRHRDREVVLSMTLTSAVVDADETYLTLLMENLLNNADKYSPQGTPIEVRVTAAGNEAMVLVCDRGIGFGDSPPEALFEPFYRSQEARSAATGLGIGLALCQRIVLALGGRIWASPREGGGAEIGFALPIADPAFERASDFTF